MDGAAGCYVLHFSQLPFLTGVFIALSGLLFCSGYTCDLGCRRAQCTSDLRLPLVRATSACYRDCCRAQCTSDLVLFLSSYLRVSSWTCFLAYSFGSTVHCCCSASDLTQRCVDFCDMSLNLSGSFSSPVDGGDVQRLDDTFVS